MTETKFWDLIDNAGSHAATLEELVDNLRGRLGTKSRAEVVDFQRCLNSVMTRAYCWDLIAAACFLGCGLSDDGFVDFRAWLVAQGRDTFERVLKDVSTLADMPYHESPTEEWYAEELQYVPSEIGREEDDSDWPYRFDPEVPHGKEITLSKEELRRRFPRLWATFGDRFMIGIS